MKDLIILAIELCRKFRLLYNERTTILSQADEFQIVQFCMACHKQKTSENFDAKPAETICMVEKIQCHQENQLKELLSLLKFNLEQKGSSDTPGGAQEIVGETIPDGKKTDDLKDDIHKSKKPQTEPAAVCDEILSEDDNEVLALVSSHKNTNNHATILDCLIKFVGDLLKESSDLQSSLKSWKSSLVLTCEDGPFFSIQIAICEVLELLNRNITRRENSVCTNSQESDLPELLVMSQGKATNDAHKTPVRSRLPKNSFESPVLNSTPKTPATPFPKKMMQKRFVQDLFRCYIHLLVNSRSQLALARVFNIPERGLDHVAFTHLKREALTAGLSMYQYVSSFVLRIRLGGQGYAPSSDSPLMTHIKGLGSLLDFTQKLQTIIEEVPNISLACKKVVNIIKNSLIQCKSGRFHSSLVEPCAEAVHASLAAIIGGKPTAVASPQRDVSTGGSQLGRQSLHALQAYLDQTALQINNETDYKMLQDMSFSSQTPTRIPCLLSQFRSPCIMDNDEDMESTEVSEAKDQKRLSSLKSNFVSSALFFEEEPADILLSQKTLASIEVLPSITLAHPRAGGQDTGTMHSSDDNIDKKAIKTMKRKSDSNRENIDSNCPTTKATNLLLEEQETKNLIGDTTPKSSKKAARKMNPKPKREGKTCRKKLLPQVKGQSKITGFFS